MSTTIGLTLSDAIALLDVDESIRAEIRRLVAAGEENEKLRDANTTLSEGYDNARSQATNARSAYESSTTTLRNHLATTEALRSEYFRNLEEVAQIVGVAGWSDLANPERQAKLAARVRELAKPAVPALLPLLTAEEAGRIVNQLCGSTWGASEVTSPEERALVLAGSRETLARVVAVVDALIQRTNAAGPPEPDPTHEAYLDGLRDVRAALTAGASHEEARRV